MSKIKVQEIEHTTSSTPAITIAQNNDVTCNAGLTATSFTGDGANLTNLPVDLTNLNADHLTSGTVLGDRLPNPLPAIDGSLLTGISAGALEHVANYSIGAGAQVQTIEVSNIPYDGRYLLRGYMATNNNGGELNIYPHIYDFSTMNQYDWTNQLSSLDSSTQYINSYSGNQMSNGWQVYAGGNYWEQVYFEMYFTTYYRPHAVTRMYSDTNSAVLVTGNHRDTASYNVRKINGFTFYNNWGYYWNDRTKLSLYKLSHY